ncbi:MAG: hypothetical protein LBD33_00465 [Puniceicoccales bacterium]|nr:hypothetical protein [Puniceicoccales bacterium]
MRKRRAFIGFDGFVDSIVRVVDCHRSDGRTLISSIDAFGRRVLGAKGKSTNIELETVNKKFGGNGPILSEALRKLGFSTIYVGTVGHEIFKQFSEHNGAISIGEPGETLALEFEDGKIIFGEMRDVARVDIDWIFRHIDRQYFVEILNSCDLLCFVNWTMLIGLGSILEFAIGEIVGDEKIFFFDLADPEKRTLADLRTMCSAMGNFAKRGKVILGANLKEAGHILSAMGEDENIVETRESMVDAAMVMQKTLGIQACFVHANTAAAGYDGAAASVVGYFSPHPKILTGAGDHFNGGFLSEYVENFNMLSALHSGSAAARYYIDSAISPNIQQMEEMKII